jgi:hypothetical protein
MKMSWYDITQWILKTADRVITTRINKLPRANVRRFVTMVTCSQNRRGPLDNSELFMGENFGERVGRSKVKSGHIVKVQFGSTVALYVI